MQKRSKNKEKFQKIEKRISPKQQKNNQKLIKQNDGITLLALCITIIVILILASITIGTISGDNGILNNATMAKERSEIADEKEIIGTAIVRSMGKNKRGDLEEDEFQNELDKILGERLATVTLDTEDYGFFVKFETSGRIYKVDRNGNVEYLGIESELITQADITATPESNTTPELTQTVELTIETPILIEGAEYSLVYSWSKDKENAPEDSQFTEEKNLEGTGRIRKATVNSNDTEEGDYYLWVRIVVGEIEKEKCFGPYAIKDHTTLAKVENNENTATSGFLGSEEKNEDVTRGKIEKIEIVNTKTGHSLDDSNCWDVSQSKNGAYLAWYEDKDNDGYYEITIGGEGGVVANSNSSNLFANIGYGVENQEVEIMGLENLDTELVENMNNMFLNAKMQELDLNSFNTSKVTTLISTFEACTNLTKLEVNNWDTSNVTMMGYYTPNFAYGGTFKDCYKLKEIDLSKWNTAKVNGMGYMFSGCSSLTSLDLRNFDTSNVFGMLYMFKDCTNLKELNIQNFNTSKVSNIDGMFRNCKSLINLDLSSFNTSNVTVMRGIFSSCSSLINLDLSNFNTSKVTVMQNMFNGCRSLISLDLSNFNVENVTNMDYMFSGSNKLVDLNLSNFNTEKLTSARYMFSKCISLKKLDISNFNVNSLTRWESMLYLVPTTIEIKTNTNTKNWLNKKFPGYTNIIA